MKITMQMIADLAGVSRATVDKVIHNRPGVSDHMREKIKQIILETNYQPLKIRKYSQDDHPPIRISVILPNLQDLFMNEMKNGMDHAYLEYHFMSLKIDYYYCVDYEPQQLLSILSYLKTQKIDGIILRGLNNKKIISEVNSFIDREIPVITIDADLAGSRRTNFIGEDLYQTGQLCASLLAKSIGKQGKIGILTGSNQVSSCLRRIRGFSDYLKEHTPNVQIVALEETLSQQTLTYQKTKKILKNHPDICGLWNCANYAEEMAQAVIDEGLTDKIHIISLLLNPRIAELIRSGIIDYTIILSPRELGYIAVKSMIETIISSLPETVNSVQPAAYIACDANIDLFQNLNT